MKTEYKGLFLKDLKKVKDKNILSRVEVAILAVKQAENLQEVQNCIKLQGSSDHYRIRIGGFRIGLSVKEDVIQFMRFLSRGEIYKHFP